MTETAPNELRLTFPRSRRLRSPADFKRVYDQKVRDGDDHLLVYAAVNDLSCTRIGVSVSKKNGNSIVRHRIRRLLKEAYRLEQFQIPEGIDLILIPRPGSASTLTDCRSSIVQLAEKLFVRLT